MNDLEQALRMALAGQERALPSGFGSSLEEEALVLASEAKSRVLAEYEKAAELFEKRFPRKPAPGQSIHPFYSTSNLRVWDTGKALASGILPVTCYKVLSETVDAFVKTGLVLEPWLSGLYVLEEQTKLCPSRKKLEEIRQHAKPNPSF